MKKWFFIIIVLLGFVAKALIYQAQGKILEAVLCLGWFVVANAALGALFAGIQNIEKQKQEMRRTKKFKEWYAEDQAAREEGGEDE
jgi:hypothetical protein